MKQELQSQILNFVGKEEKDGKLYLKYYVADSSLNPSIGGVTSNSLVRVMPSGVDKPFVLTDGETNFPGGNVWHPFSSNPDPTPESEIEFAQNYSIGKCVMMTQLSELKRGAAVDPTLSALGIQDDGWFAVMEVTDLAAKEALLDGNGYFPPQISIGFLVHKSDARKLVIDNYDIVHFAACPKGSYGDKTHFWKGCIGEKGVCLDALRGAAANVSVSYSSQKSAEQAVRDINKAIDKLREIDKNDSYDVDVNQNKISMSAVKTETVDSKDQKTEIPNEEKKESKVEDSKESIEKVETNNDNSAVSDKSEKDEINTKNPNSEMQKEIDDLKQFKKDSIAEKKLAIRKEEVRKLVPTELFKNMEEWEQEVNARVEQNTSNEVLKELYDAKMAALNLSKMQSAPTNSNNPFGGENEQVTSAVEPNLFRGAAKTDKINDAHVTQIAKSLLLCNMKTSILPERNV